MMNKFSYFRLKECFLKSNTKLDFNKDLFDHIAPKYNKATKILSFFQDQNWKTTLISSLPKIEKPNCLDLACGTGDVTFKLSKKYPQATIFGLDISQEMIDEAVKLNQSSNIKFVCEDMCSTSFEDHYFDIITGSYALRNSPDLNKTLNEIYRILKPNGFVGILDFSKFDNKFARKIQYYLLKFWGSLWGIILHGNRHIYGYIAESLKYHPSSTKLKKIINQFDFEFVQNKRLFFGFLEIMIFKKK